MSRLSALSFVVVSSLVAFPAFAQPCWTEDCDWPSWCSTAPSTGGLALVAMSLVALAARRRR